MSDGDRLVADVTEKSVATERSATKFFRDPTKTQIQKDFQKDTREACRDNNNYIKRLAMAEESILQWCPLKKSHHSCW